MSADRLRLAELPPADRMAYEIDEGARALGLTLPTREHVAVVMGLLKRLQGQFLSPQRVPLERYNLASFTSFATLGIDQEKIISGLVLWNSEGRSKSGNIPVPHLLWLVKTDYTQDHGDIVPVATPKVLDELGTKDPERYQKILTDWIPVVRYPIAEIPVGTTQCNFDYEKKAPIRSTIHREGRVLIRKTVRQ